MLARIQRNWNLCAFFVKWYSCCWKPHGGSSEKLSIELPYDPAMPVLGMGTKRMKSTDSSWYLYTSVHCSIIHNSQKVDTTQMSIDRWMNTNMIYLYNGILFSLTRKEILTCYNMDEPWGHAKWKKPITGQILCDSTYMSYIIYVSSQTHRDINSES